MTTYLKSIYAVLTTAIGAISTAYVAGGGHIGWVAALTISGAALSAGAAVWGVPNATTK